jgi:hypothetical protein
MWPVPTRDDLLADVPSITTGESLVRWRGWAFYWAKHEAAKCSLPAEALFDAVMAEAVEMRRKALADESSRYAPSPSGSVASMAARR